MERCLEEWEQGAGGPEGVSFIKATAGSKSVLLLFKLKAQFPFIPSKHFVMCPTPTPLSWICSPLSENFPLCSTFALANPGLPT